MDLNYLRKLLKIFDDSTATELMIEEEGIKLQLSRKEEAKSETTGFMMPFNMSPYPTVQSQNMNQQTITKTPEPITTTQTATDEQPEITLEKSGNKHEINSPIVGTFYRAPSPDSESFVEVGTHVIPGTTLCIIEAMKLMNEIESDVAGVVEKIHIENSKPVEYNQLLFTIKPD